jgi:pimeloyl-ACP methyl ester carboxylesterase
MCGATPSVVAFDFPAHGRSQGEYGTMLDFASAIADAVRVFGNVHAIIGHSFGAQSAAWLLSHTHDLGVQNLVMIAAGGNIDFLVDASPAFADATEADRAAMRQSFLQRIGRPMTDFDVTRVAHTVRVPTLLIHDTRDLLVPYAHAEAYASAIPNNRLMTTAGLGHRSILRAPEVVAAAVGWVISPTVLPKHAA